MSLILLQVGDYARIRESKVLTTRQTVTRIVRPTCHRAHCPGRLYIYNVVYIPPTPIRGYERLTRMRNGSLLFTKTILTSYKYTTIVERARRKTAKLIGNRENRECLKFEMKSRLLQEVHGLLQSGMQWFISILPVIKIEHSAATADA